MHLRDPLRAAAIARPNDPALIAPDRTLSYRTLDRVVTATAAHLRAIGVDPGMGVGLYLPRSWPAVVLLVAVMRAQAVACPLSTRLPPERVAEHLRRARSVLLITDDHAVTAAVEDEVAVFTASAVLLTGKSRRRTEPHQFHADQPATVVFTSGSTGVPKAVLHTIGNHYFSAEGANQNIPLGPGDRWLLSLPLYHVGGLAILFRCWLAGATAILAAPGAALDQALVEQRITHASMVPAQLRRLLRAEGAAPALDGLEALLLGGGVVPAALLEEAHARDAPLYTTYGMTEASSQVTTTPPDASIDRLRTAGRCLPHRRLKIDDDGEILVRGKTLFRGYIEAEALHDPRDAAGWFHTGDLGTVDEDGYLHVRGRKDHRFISGGENIQPEEVERALVQLDGVRRAMVVPVPNAEFGQRPVAFVEGAAEGASAAHLTERLARRLPRFMIPDRFYPWPEDVDAGNQKEYRRHLQAEALRRQRASV